MKKNNFRKNLVPFLYKQRFIIIVAALIVAIIPFLFKTKTKTVKIDVVNYIQKYKYVLEKEVEVKTVPGYEDVIWTCWLQGEENAPRIVKVCWKTLAKNNPNSKIIIITEKNLDQYITLPKYIKDKYHRGIISKTHLSDYIRLCLLQKYGGTWTDASCYFTDKIPNEIFRASFFQFKNPFWYLCKNVPSINMLKSMNRVQPKLTCWHTGSNWFLYAKPNNPIINKTKLLLEEYWKKENYLIDYFLFHYFLTFAVMNDKTCKNEFYKMINMNNVYPHVLQFVFKEIYNEQLYDEIKRGSFVHKLTWKIDLPKKDDFYNFLLDEKD